MTVAVATTVALILGMVGGCEKKGAPKPPNPVGPTAVAPASPSAATVDAIHSSSTSDATIVEVGGIVMSKPSTWMWQSPTMAFRTLQYSVPAQGSGSAAELVFSEFRKGDGGPLDQNIARWSGQFRGEDGQSAPFEQSVSDIDTMRVTRLSFRGAYQGMGAAAPRTGMAQLSAIVEGPEFNVFIRLVGAEATVDLAAADFAKMIESLRLAAKTN